MSEERSTEEGSANLFARLADMGEEAIQRVGDMPGISRLTEPIVALRERVDELQRRVRGLDALQRRVDELEQRLAQLEANAAPTTEGDVLAQATPPTAPARGFQPTATADPISGDPTGGTAGSEETGLSSPAP
jgi:polyhydroxyalkanoate synthesis regulator phasin